MAPPRMFHDEIYSVEVPFLSLMNFFMENPFF